MAETAPTSSRRSEFGAFVILAFAVVPALAIAGVGGMGLGIWLWNLANGVVEAPPGAH